MLNSYIEESSYIWRHFTYWPLLTTGIPVNRQNFGQCSVILHTVDFRQQSPVISWHSSFIWSHWVRGIEGGLLYSSQMGNHLTDMPYYNGMNFYYISNPWAIYRTLWQCYIDAIVTYSGHSGHRHIVMIVTSINRKLIWNSRFVKSLLSSKIWHLLFILSQVGSV
jgi:hypothetical protein